MLLPYKRAALSLLAVGCVGGLNGFSAFSALPALAAPESAQPATEPAEGASPKPAPVDLNKVLNINQVNINRGHVETQTEGDIEHEAALKAAALAAQQRKNDALQHYDAARVYLGAGNTEMAELELQAAIWKDGSVRAFHRDYCVVALLRGHPMRAVAEAVMVFGLGDAIDLSEAQANKLQDNGCKLHYRRGLELAKNQKWKEAVSEFQWALRYRPRNPKVMRSMAFANASMGNIELAEKQYGSSFAEDPSDAYGHADFAYLLADTGNAEEALKQLQEAVKLQPKVAALHIDLGWMAESKGNLAEAEGQFAEATKLSPNHAALWAHLGRVQSREGKAEQAGEAYAKAKALDPSIAQAN
jgi:Flp pilus assembly protein TadD